MRILLLNPPDRHSARIATRWDVSIGTVGRFPPLGLLALAAWIRRDPRFAAVRVIDGVAGGLTADELGAVAASWQADVVGITAFTYTWFDALATVRAVRRQRPAARIVVGGPHTTLFPAETLAHPEIDAVVIGEGEEPLARLLDAWTNDRLPMPGEGLALRTPAGPAIGGPAHVPDLGELPIPAYDLLDPAAYRSTFGHGGQTLTVASSRGCPYRCTFCQVLVRRYRALPLGDLLDTVQWGVDRGYRQFYFFDDLFNLTVERVEQFAAGLLAAGHRIQWVFRGRVDRVTDRMCELAKASGCVQMIFGVEAHTDADLAAIRKGIRIVQVRRALTLARRHHLEVSTNWIIGLPTHRCESDLEDLARTVIRLRPDYAMFSILQLLPGCELYRQAVAEGVVRHEDWLAFAREPVPDFRIPFYDRFLPGSVQEDWYRRLHDRFYRRPGFMLRRLTRLRSLDEFRDKARVGLRLLGLA